jgi:Cft2 family RNA processing exonuclease
MVGCKEMRNYNLTIPRINICNRNKKPRTHVCKQVFPTSPLPKKRYKEPQNNQFPLKFINIHRSSNLHIKNLQEKKKKKNVKEKNFCKAEHQQHLRHILLKAARQWRIKIVSQAMFTTNRYILGEAKFALEVYKVH